MATGRFPQRSGTVSRKWKVERGKQKGEKGSGVGDQVLWGLAI